MRAPASQMTPHRLAWLSPSLPLPPSSRSDVGACLLPQMTGGARCLGDSDRRTDCSSLPAAPTPLVLFSCHSSIDRSNRHSSSLYPSRAPSSYSPLPSPLPLAIPSQPPLIPHDQFLPFS